MSGPCVDVAYYWTPEEAGAIVDYLDHLRDTVWEMYSDDIIQCRTKELDVQVDPRQQHLDLDNASPSSTSQVRTPASLAGSGAHRRESERMTDDCIPREALPSLDDLPSLSDENIGDMLKLLRTLLHACEEHYKDPIRRLDEQRHRELFPDYAQDRPTWSDKGRDEDF